MGDISQGRNVGGYESSESRRIAALDARMAALEAEVERLRVYVEGRTKERQEAYRRMMQSLSGASVAGGGE